MAEYVCVIIWFFKLHYSFTIKYKWVRIRKMKSYDRLIKPNLQQMRQTWKSLDLLKSNVREKDKIMQQEWIQKLNNYWRFYNPPVVLILWNRVSAVTGPYLNMHIKLWYRLIFWRRSCSNIEHYLSQPTLLPAGQRCWPLPLSSGRCLQHRALRCALLCPYLSREMQHRWKIDAVVSRTSSDVRTRQNISP